MKRILKGLGIWAGFFLFSSGYANATTATPAILFLHGFSLFGTPVDCTHDFSKMEDGFKAAGITSSMVTVGYYANDTKCDVKPSTKSTILSHISDLSQDLAWYIYNQFSSKNVTVDIVAHSMGGLMTRYALYRVAVGDPSFPPYLSVAHAATLSSPYEGYSLIGELCHIDFVNIQCDEMFPYSQFIQGLKTPQALVPQGRGGTNWANLGSKADIFDGSDGFVTATSATSMNIQSANKTIFPWYDFIFHNGFPSNAKVIALVANFLMNRAPAQSVEQFDSFNMSQSDFTVSRNEIYADFDQLSQNEKASEVSPYLVNSQQQGVQFSNVLPNGIISKMGIQNDDIVQGCSASTLNKPFAGLAKGETSTESFAIKFCIIRKGVKLALQVTVR